MIEKKINRICIFLAFICSITVFGIGGYFFGKSTNIRVVHVDFESLEQKEVFYGDTHIYKFLDKEKSDYIYKLANELKIDPDLAVAILMQENPEYNPEATNKNKNGTLDIGLFQINSSNVWGNFQKSYWNFDIEFNPYDWKHNTYMALRHIADLSNSLKIMDEVICAYNCGTRNVMNRTIPDSTKIYLARVKNNYRLLKEAENVQ